MEKKTYDNKEAFDDVIGRLDQLEKGITEVKNQLNMLMDTFANLPMKNIKTGEEMMALHTPKKQQNAEIARDIFEKLGISGKPIPAEELQAQMAKNGIRAEDNEFSRAIIEEREK